MVEAYGAFLMLTIFCTVAWAIITILNVTISETIKQRVLEKLHLDIENMKPYED